MKEPSVESAGYAQDIFSPLQFCEVVQERQGGQSVSQNRKNERSTTRLPQLSASPVGNSMTHMASTSMPDSSQQHTIIQTSTTMAQLHMQQQLVHLHQQQQITVHQQQSAQVAQQQSMMQQMQQQQQQHHQQMQQVQEQQTQQQLLNQQVQQQVQIPQQIQQQVQIPQQIQQQGQIPLVRIPQQTQLKQLPQQPSQHPAQHSQQQSRQTTQQQHQTPQQQQQQQQSHPTQQQQQQQQSPQQKPHITLVQGNPIVDQVVVVPGPQLSIVQTCNSPDIAPEIIVITEQNLNFDTAEASGKKTSVITKEVKLVPILIKHTWRRPWKKKKEREKKQPVKKARRIRRRRMITPKKNNLSVDPKNGPPIDTQSTAIKRESEETINQLKQKRQRIKLNRNSGREYVNRLGKVVNARKIGPPCNCPLKCWDRMGSKILEIFNNFWDLSDFNLQNSYLFTCLKLCDVKRRYTKKSAEESRRQNTFEYFVRINGKHLRVCKRGFMSSHGLTSDKRLRTLFHQMKDGALIPEPDRRGKHLRPAKSPNQLSPNHMVEQYNNQAKAKKPRQTKKKVQQKLMDGNKSMYTPPPNMGHILPHCTPPPPPPAHAAAMQEPPHAYIPNGEIYFPGHYLEPHQTMGPPHMNQIPSCQKMLEAPAYFMAGMKENTFHQ